MNISKQYFDKVPPAIASAALIQRPIMPSIIPKTVVTRDNIASLFFVGFEESSKRKERETIEN